MPKPKATRNIPKTEPFDFIYGKYHLSQWCIPYFFTSMSLRHASECLKRFDEFPGVEQMNWRIEELYQRDLDWSRVERKIVPYLRATGQPQFFNALTVALLPITAASVVGGFESGNWQPPEMEQPEEFEKVVSIGPITCAYYEAWQSTSDPGAKLGKIRWNPREIFSVAIDGQHRLAAIKKLVETSGTSSRMDESQVPVILLVFDPRLGYLSPADSGLVDVLRALFIDLNKHAQPVGRSRQILLDDKDPHSLCVRALVGEQLMDGDSDLSLSPPRLPLSLLDWHSDQAKFDHGPYLATILGLDWMVTRVLGTQPIRDYMNYTQIRSQIKAFKKALAVDLNDAEIRLKKQEEVQQQPFRYSDSGGVNELSDILIAFKTIWVPALVKVLTELSPYSELIAERRTQGTLSTEFVTWYHLFQRKEQEKFAGEATTQYGRFIQQVGSREHNPIGPQLFENQLNEIEALKQFDEGDRGNFAFNVVFQKALIAAFVEFSKIDETHVGEILPEDEEDFDDVLSEDGEVDDELDEEVEEAVEDEVWSATDYMASVVSQRADVFVAAINALIESQPQFLDKDCPYDHDGEEAPFWLGTLLTAEGNIDFTMAAAGRAKELIFWVATIYLLRTIDDDLCDEGVEAFWDGLDLSEARIHKSIRRSIARFTKDERGSASTRILTSQGFDFDQDVANDEAYYRLAWIWTALDDACES
jgi:hypothetical protein